MVWLRSLWQIIRTYIHVSGIYYKIKIQHTPIMIIQVVLVV